jgi:cytochrome c-type biogenesis protein CcmF
MYRLLRRNGRRYGGYLVHLGVVAIALAVLGSQLYHVERQVTLRPGETATVGGYTVQFAERREYADADRRVTEGVLAVRAGGRDAGWLYPSKSTYRGFEQQATTSVAIRTTPLEDLYVVLNGWDSGSASFLLVVNPLVVWLWVGGGIVLVGTIFTMWPRPVARAVRATQAAPEGAVAYGD